MSYELEIEDVWLDHEYLLVIKVGDEREDCHVKVSSIEDGQYTFQCLDLHHSNRVVGAHAADYRTSWVIKTLL